MPNRDQMTRLLWESLRADLVAPPVDITLTTKEEAETFARKHVEPSHEEFTIGSIIPNLLPNQSQRLLIIQAADELATYKQFKLSYLLLKSIL